MVMETNSSSHRRTRFLPVALHTVDVPARQRRRKSATPELDCVQPRQALSVINHKAEEISWIQFTWGLYITRTVFILAV
jgi:hypothetical protein